MARRTSTATTATPPAASSAPISAPIPALAPPHPDPEALLAHLAGAGVLAGTVGPNLIRLVTHLDVDDAGVDRACRALAAAA